MGTSKVFQTYSTLDHMSSISNKQLDFMNTLLCPFYETIYLIEVYHFYYVVWLLLFSRELKRVVKKRGFFHGHFDKSLYELSGLLNFVVIVME